MQGKNSFTFYTNWKEIFDKFDYSRKGMLIDLLMAYTNDLIPEDTDIEKYIEDNGIDFKVYGAFIGMQPILKQDLRKWKNKREVNIENGKKGGRPTKTQKTHSVFENPTKPKKGVNVKVKVNDNVLSNDNTNNNRFNKLNLVTISNCNDSEKNDNFDNFYIQNENCNIQNCDNNIQIDTNNDIKNNFIIFWKAYPKYKKQGKGNCERWFISHKINTKEKIDKIINCLEEFKKSKQWNTDKRYIPLPHTWLNRKDWENEDLELEMSDKIIQEQIDLSDFIE